MKLEGDDKYNTCLFVLFRIIDINLIFVNVLQFTQTQGQKRTNLVQQAVVNALFEVAINLDEAVPQLDECCSMNGVIATKSPQRPR